MNKENTTPFDHTLYRWEVKEGIAKPINPIPFDDLENDGGFNGLRNHERREWQITNGNLQFATNARDGVYEGLAFGKPRVQIHYSGQWEFVTSEHNGELGVGERWFLPYTGTPNQQVEQNDKNVELIERSSLDFWNTPFSHELLPKLFENIKMGRQESIYIRYSVYGDGGFIGDINYCDATKEFTYFIDNFPGPKLYYTTSIPYKTVLDFYRDMQRIKLHVQPLVKEQADTRSEGKETVGDDTAIKILKQAGVNVDVLKDVQCRDGKPGSELDRIVNAMWAFAVHTEEKIQKSAESVLNEYCSSVIAWSDLRLKSVIRAMVAYATQHTDTAIAELKEQLEKSHAAHKSALDSIEAHWNIEVKQTKEIAEYKERIAQLEAANERLKK